MRYAELLERTELSQPELLAMAHGTLLEDAPEGFPRLPAPPLLMLDRVTEMSGEKRATLVAEQDVRVDAWFYQCHFIGDPVHPGCLMIDALWQLLGLHLVLRGEVGSPRALGCGEIELSGQIRPHHRLVRYRMDVRRTQRAQEATLVVADGTVEADGATVATMARAKLGFFRHVEPAGFPYRPEGGA